MENEILEKRFGGDQIRPEYAEFKKSKAIILQCPYEATASYKKGTKKGPEAIIDASAYLEMFDDELKVETYKIGIYTKPPMDIENLSSEDMIEKIRQEVLDAVKSEKLPVILGGEHSISIGAVKALKEVYKDMSILHLDAHHDLRDEYTGTKLSHACVTRRFLEYCPVVQTGVRSLCKDEHDFIMSNPSNLKVVTVYDILEEPLWKEEVVKSLSDTVYISLDMDVFDPAIVPAVGTPEPGGIGWYEMLDLLKMVIKNKRIVGFDLMELMPIENMAASDFLAAKLLYRILGYIYFSRRK